jgi:outer membrane PBP1 activator LpoA protein
MTRKILPSLLGSCMLVLLTACSSNPPQPISLPGEAAESTATKDIAKNAASEDAGDKTGANYHLALDQVMALTQRLDGYDAATILSVVRSLESLRSSELERAIQAQSYDPEFTEWLELTLRLRQALLDKQAADESARHWRDFHYGHAVTGDGFIDLLAKYRQAYPAPLNVAVLLPNEGGLAPAAMAIRDGILRAYLDEPGNTNLRFYSSGTSSESAIDAYHRARADGADQVIGPLRLESTEAISKLAALDIPALVLNRADRDESSGESQLNSLVTSISLSQADEAEAIAMKALQAGRKRVIIIVPDSAWGRRIENAFAVPFVQHGGLISARAEFQRNTSDHSAMLTSLLKIDESQARKTRLQVQIGAPLTFEPIRRDDFDFIFMAASPQEGRELKPLLKFHDAGEVPVYSIGRIYSGRPEVSRDQDLNGIVFTAVQWQLNEAASKQRLPDSVREGAQGKLYALGQDAWRLLPWIPLMKKDADLDFRGEVGHLGIDNSGQIQRQPAWAQFIDGKPMPFRWPGHF